MIIRSFLLSLVTFSAFEKATAQPTTISSSTCWEIESTSELKRWIIVRGYDEGSKVFHVEVLAQKPKSKPWEFLRLAPHLAITEKALKRSVKKPIKNGDVYPESHNSAYHRWEKQTLKERFICDDDVLHCVGESGV